MTLLGVGCGKGTKTFGGYECLDKKRCFICKLDSIHRKGIKGG